MKSVCKCLVKLLKLLLIVCFTRHVFSRAKLRIPHVNLWDFWNWCLQAICSQCLPVTVPNYSAVQSVRFVLCHTAQLTFVKSQMRLIEN